MKIAIITFHNTSNFGATLQCAALSHCLKNRCHNVKVINYLPQYILDKKSVFKEFRRIRTSGNKVKAMIKGIAYVFHYKEIKTRDKKFEDFISAHLDLTGVYHSFESLQTKPPKADVYICGSDQIWNPYLTGNMLDQAFFLQFTDGRKAAYGASIGEMDVDEYAGDLQKFTKSFSAISVREASSAAKLWGILHRNIDIVLDCTLLLNKDDYAVMEMPVKKSERPYLLLYNIQNSSESIAIAKELAEERQLAILDISPNPFVRVKGSEKHIDLGPGEFLTYVKNADCVVTNSFHGTVFSILYEKSFFTIPHKTRSGRTVDLLKSLNLEQRVVNNPESLPNEEVDYTCVSEALRILRINSFQYIDRVLSQNS